MLNPAVRPHELLSSLIGSQQNFHTGERYEFTLRDVEELRALEVAAITPERYFLIAATGDEVLDYRAAVTRYQGCRQVVIEGGDHGLSDFVSYVGPVLEFCGTGRRAG